MKFILFLLLGLLIGHNSYAQLDSLSLDTLKDYELQLAGLGFEILNGSDDQTKATSTRQFIRTLVKALKVRGSWHYPFDSLKSVSILKPSDNSFRIFNWNLPTSKGKYFYFGAIQLNSMDLKLFPLLDSSDKIKNVADTITDNNFWYGCHYYKLIESRHKKKNYYTLFGWDGNDPGSNRNIIEVLTFNEGKPVFGHPMFKLEKNRVVSRVLFEYSEAVKNVVVRYNEKKKIIFYENLIPPKPSATGIFSTYLPDGSFDYLEFKKGFWVKGQKAFETLKLE